MNNHINFESLFFEVMDDLHEYLGNIILIGGWMPFVYSRFLWNKPRLKIITTTDIDFGVVAVKTINHPKTIFETLSSLDYIERHPEMDKKYPVVLYKTGNLRLDFIASLNIEDEIANKLVGRQIDLNKLEKFDILSDNKIIVIIKDNGGKDYRVNCPKPSAFLFHKAITFIDRVDENKQAKDLHYMYFILRYAPDLDIIFREISNYGKSYQIKNASKKISKFFTRKTSYGCLWVEKENGPDEYIDDLRQDIYERFSKLREFL